LYVSISETDSFAIGRSAGSRPILGSK
jgi:hypothetical protein